LVFCAIVSNIVGVEFLLVPVVFNLHSVLAAVTVDVVSDVVLVVDGFLVCQTGRVEGC
jgi:hypothetical protein